MDLCKSNMEMHHMAADSQTTDDKEEHFVAADLISGLSDQMTVRCYENQSVVECLEMTDLTVGKGQSSTETPVLRMMDQGKSSNEGESSNEGKSSTETRALASRMMDQGNSSSEGQSSTETRAFRMMDHGKSSSEGQSSTEMQVQSSNESKSSTETHASRMMDQGKKSSFRMVLDCDENGMPNWCKYYEMLECEDVEEEDEEMTPEGVRMYNKFRKELLEMEAGLRKDREQDQKDALRWERDQIDTPSCYTMDPIPFSLQDEAEETEFTKSDTEEMEMADKLFALGRKGWESAWGDDCGNFEDSTVLSPMHFTHCTPGLIPYAARTVSILQIYSVKIVGTDGKLKLPLHVYGIVAARDAVDYNRNILFSWRRENCQKLTPEDHFLRLTGPSRAIVAVDDVDFEVQLKVKGSSRSRDRALMSHCFTYAGGYHEGLHTTFSSNSFCTVEFSYERLTETVQATILSARVVEGAPWPFEYGGRVMCSSPPREVTDSLSRQVVLVDSRRSDGGGEMPMGSDGFLDLSRHVVSIELEESLQIVVQAYSQSGDAIARQGSVRFRTKYCNISRAICEIGDSKVEITVAWSQLAKHKRDILLEGHV
ncbi:uncharacterized protein LOC125538989 [Triticum urartu]|uniref:DUF6598 domain-containing protein n=1 Tax=Triticum urartu TaxID=4572 RepID=A0A8R7TL13_TRIUA|nr:uncharacterized protein LOC125538989 [Triticum urartu]